VTAEEIDQALRRVVAEAQLEDSFRLRQGKAASLAALRRSPLVGADLDLARPREKGRKVRI